MSGYTKRKCQNDFRQAIIDMNKYIKTIMPILPYEYNLEVIKGLLEKYYPHEMKALSVQYKYYQTKEKSLVKHKKSRYSLFLDVEGIILSSAVYKTIMSEKYISNHKTTFSKESTDIETKKLSSKREAKIKKIDDKIQRSLQKTQQVEPEFLDALMGLYDRKQTTQKDKVYILNELQKYYNDKVLKFFSKKIDTEYNIQLREMAFHYYQSVGFRPVLRKQKHMRVPSKNRNRKAFLKNDYAHQRFDILGTPEELEYRIENSKEQVLKHYDFFISHSSSDQKEVQALIENLNKNRKNVYCDWINDNDYLKRVLVGDATLNIIKNRMKQSKQLLFVLSKNSLSSIWCKYELNEFKNQEKEILYITVEDIQNKIFNYVPYSSEWFIDQYYEQLPLFKTN